MAGFKYEMPPEVERELCDISTIKRMTGGVNIKANGLSDDFRIPPLAPLAVVVNGTKREGEVLIRARVTEAASGSKVKVAKGIPLSAGMFLSDGTNSLTVKSVDTTNEAYDEITASSAITGFVLGAVAFEATDGSSNKAKGVATNLNYSWQKVKNAKSNGMTPIYRAFEVRESKLYIPLTEADKDSLRKNGVYVFTY
ncbi:hypothetical protein [Bacteroides pyogenes]|uniref:hypothetical protein n=1 Tax=Bacteroides pyogenes TaxID=310300 RepID=UPI001BAA5B13|nr:hypothetical protein [Bacteroides pyogenes]MBR8706884.1 hypothetical protein [Bacteroides pyogenes]MBR8726185.1 hypothetical protein [Bacteroides pyogenes]MBR8739564.1 hypothetical protein [Bacteroides pyogenes]MBR8755394.1 hypothetical protein [Bacteroides pyogenes]MBR8796678.1 hypothetical protein [Bacteroides pyogenes]